MYNTDMFMPNNYTVSSLFTYPEVKTDHLYKKNHLLMVSGLLASSYYCVSSLTRIDDSSEEKINDFLINEYKPRTELGKKLIEIRRKFFLKHGKFLSTEEIDREIELRRGRF